MTSVPSAASCNLCGQTWPRDPRLEVPCPSCAAPIGRPCKRPSGHAGNFVQPHIPREQLAIDSGFLTKECPAMNKKSKARHSSPITRHSPPRTVPPRPLYRPRARIKPAAWSAL